MRAFTAIAAILIALALACRDDGSTTPPPARVTFPSWISPENRALAQAEIDASGLPLDWRVVVTVPIFETRASPTGIARGLTDYDHKVIIVGWRIHPYETRPVLPALEHEVGHVFGGPEAGH